MRGSPPWRGWGWVDSDVYYTTHDERRKVKVFFFRMIRDKAGRFIAEAGKH